MSTLSQEQSMVVETLEELATSHFADRACEWGGEVPWENAKLLADNGFVGINYEETYGGGGMTELEAMLAVETVGRVCPDTANYLYTQQLVAPRFIASFGSKAVKEQYLPPVCAGESWIVIAISEPQAGSDVMAMNTTVSEDGGEYTLNGEKLWVSEVPDAAAAVVWAKFPEGLGAVVIDLDAPGVEVGQHFANMSDHSQSQLFFEDVLVRDEQILSRGDEFKAMLGSLNWERMGSSTLTNAIAGCALRHALDFADQREQFGQPIGDFQGIEWKLADAVKKLEASRALTYRAARKALAEERPPSRLDASLAKLYSAEMAETVVSEALQVFGANGYQQGHPLEYLYRLVRGRRIAAGTDEMQKNSIAAVLKRDGLPTVS